MTCETVSYQRDACVEDSNGEAPAWCPYCGEAVRLTLDPGGAAVQEYVEDCGVCCNPWDVTVRYHADGSAEVTLRTVDE
jgi:hypothetical protein